MTRDHPVPQDALSIEDPAPVILSSPKDGQEFPIGGIASNKITVPMPSPSAGSNSSNDAFFAATANKAAGPFAVDIMDQPISTNPPLAMFERKNDHPVPRYSVTNMDGVPVGTNKFWGSLVLGNGNLGVFAQPYQVWVNKDPALWGLAISHTDLSQLAYGPDPGANPVQYYYNPIGITSMALSATEFNAATSSVTTEALKPNSALVHLWANRGQFPNTKRMSCNIVHGMGFVTGRYLNLTPKIVTGVFFRSFSAAGTVVGNGATRQKWSVTLEDGKQWRIYATPNSGSRELELRLVNNSILQATGNFSGTIQIAKLANTAQESALDLAAGTVVTDINVSASVSGTVGTYVFNFAKVGGSVANAPFMYALPHQVDSFDSTTRSKLVGSLQLKSLTQGLMTGIISNSWTMVETDMPVSVGWLAGSNRSWASKTINAIRSSIASDIGFDVLNASNLSSQYFSGKAIAKYAQIVLVACDILKDANLVRQGLDKLKAAIGRFAANKQIYPLVYDTKWGGLVSSSWWRTGNDGEDFGNAFYNDHHFHYGYFIYAAALLVHIEKVTYGSSDWLNANKEWINNLVRDVANPTTKDPYFPVSRNFDIFMGHSWATGLYARGDGKDEESTSEDYNFSYAMKLWGNAIGDQNMEARANLQLAILKRALNAYFLLSNDNKNQPSNFIANKVTGILFENKVDHTTYFGNSIEFIQGIHMLPLTPISPYIRSKQFCLEEWLRFFEGKTDAMNSGWKGVLWANAAIFAPYTAFNFFASPSFSASWLDDGASRTWYLAFAAGLGGGR